jgi:hypothetical protein
MSTSGLYPFLFSLSYGGFLPTIDGITLTDSVTNLWKDGKIAKIPFIGGYVSHESGNFISRNATFSANSIGKDW